MIGLGFLHPELLGLLVLLPLMAGAWILRPPALSRRRSRLALGFRLLVVALLVLALSGVRLETQPQRRALVAVVDLSSSVTLGASPAAAEEAVRALARGRGPDDLFGVVTAGAQPMVELPPSRDPQFDTFTTSPGGGFTDLEAALKLAAGLVPAGYARQLVLITDGRQNLGDAAAAVSALRAEGVRIDVVPAGGAPAAEAMVLGLEAPGQLREGQLLHATARFRATAPAHGSVTFSVDGRELSSETVDLASGVSARSIDVPGLGPGLHRVRVEIQVQPDTLPQNNVGEAAVRVLGSPLVLILEGGPGAGGNVERALAAGGIRTERRPAAQAPTETASLGRYDATVIVDAPADAFPAGALAALAGSVRELGRGLVAIGGKTAYGPGGWQGTPLEEALPVRMDLPNRKDKPPVAVVLVMESMEDPRADQVALGAAESVIDKLTPQDSVGVTDGGSDVWALNLAPVTDRKAIEHKLEAAHLGDPATYYDYLKAAGDALRQSAAPLKHIVILGDGDADPDRRANLQPLLADLRAQGITTSAVGISVHAEPTFMAFMQDIATWGGGRFYQSNSPSDVPQLLLKETESSLRPWFEQTPFFPRVTAAGNLLDGVPLDRFPELGGYVVATAKANAEVYLASPKQDPVLSAWNYGLGRSVAWNSDAEGIWTAGFLKSPVAAEVFGHMVAWALPAATGDRLAIDARAAGDGFDVTVSGPADVAGGSLRLGVVRPDFGTADRILVAGGPGRWTGHVPAGETGVYLLHGALQRDGRTLAAADAAFALPYSPEYLDLGRDDAFLRLLARQGGGALLNAAAAAWRQPPPAVPVASDAFWGLLALAALLWPLDVAVRRLAVHPRQLLSLGRALFRRAPSEVELAVPEELARLRSRVAAHRRRRPGAPPAPVVPEPPVAGVEGVEGSPEAGREAAEKSLSARLLDARRRRPR